MCLADFGVNNNETIISINTRYLGEELKTRS